MGIGFGKKSQKQEEVQEVIFANTKLRIPYEVGDKRREGFFRLLRERGIFPNSRTSWLGFDIADEFKRFIVIDETGRFVTYYSEAGYNHSIYKDYKVITEADLKANRILDTPEAHVEDYVVKPKKQTTRKRGKVIEVKVTEKAPLSSGDIAEHTPSGAVILLGPINGTTNIKGTLLGYTKEVAGARLPGTVGQYDLGTLTRFDGKVTLSNPKVKKTRTKTKTAKNPW